MFYVPITFCGKGLPKITIPFIAVKNMGFVRSFIFRPYDAIVQRACVQ